MLAVELSLLIVNRVCNLEIETMFVQCIGGLDVILLDVLIK